MILRVSLTVFLKSVFRSENTFIKKKKKRSENTFKCFNFVEKSKVEFFRSTLEVFL